MRDFEQDLITLHDRLVRREPFAFSKYADGEYKILRNERITNCDNWTFIPSLHSKEQGLLLDSFQYYHPNYIIGISCPCCQPQEHVDWMRRNSAPNKIHWESLGTVSPIENLTWANLFVNNNYQFFVNEFIPEFAGFEGKVFLFANANGLGKELPFKVDEYVPLNIGAFLEPFLSQNITKGHDLAQQGDGNLFLFSAGPLGNILAHQLHMANPNNFYIDVGSTLNPWIVGKNRGYLNGNNTRKCIW